MAGTIIGIHAVNESLDYLADRNYLPAAESTHGFDLVVHCC